MIVRPSPKAIEDAASHLRAGELVAFPTETVYGLGADASRPEAVKKIFARKGRPKDHPLIVHLPDRSYLDTWASDLSLEAYRLAEAFWPGPLTLVVKRSAQVPDLVTAAQSTVGLRVPKHPVALDLLTEFAGGLAAPSANRFGKISPTKAEHVLSEFGPDLPILDGGACEVGLESSIVDVSTQAQPASVLRPGGISLEALAEVLGYLPEVILRPTQRVSGSLERHYSPSTETKFVSSSASLQVAQVGIGVLSRQAKPQGFAGYWLSLPKEPKAYAQAMYAALRHLDEQNLKQILIEQVPDTAEWLAVRDRLNRATS